MSAIEDLIKTVAALREPDTGCPWDIEQDHQSIAECLVDECCELLQLENLMDVHVYVNFIYIFWSKLIIKKIIASKHLG